MSIQKRILIVRPDRIGDVVLSTPLPREIKKTFPDSFVAVLVKKYTKDVYLNNPNVDAILLVDDGVPFLKKIAELRKYRFTHSLNLLPTERLNYLLFFAGIPYRVGVGHKFYQFLTFTRYVDRKKYIPLRHEADYCMDLARKIGVQASDLSAEIFLSEDEKQNAEQARIELLGGKKYLIGIHSTSGNSSPNWPPAEYMKLLKFLSENQDYTIVITDNMVPDQLKEIQNVSHPNIGRTLRESIINFASLDLLISASTGPMHLAAALKIKTLSMFCPLTACSPELWGPIGNESKIILPEENYCSSVCPGDPKKCLFTGPGGINAELISDEVKKILY
ncbi:MAG: ADP-heptose--LPS heptosyltransferase [Ignavibacteriae bacterium HGW-Ignavibacteriae-3]|nr:MAG: ADP-heptose--LPS heptosyltransferase [Ignavibacteriae bacterium HGW-Ignavibacteriae-3]